MKARALIIGINNYPGTTGQRTLAGAVDDAIDFARWANDPQGGNVDTANLYFWVHADTAMPAGLEQLVADDRSWPSPIRPDFSSPPSAPAIIRAITAAADAAANSGKDERLYVFLAGHGAMTQRLGHSRDPQNCFVAGDYVLGDAYGLVPLDDVRRLLEMRGPLESLVISDCCRNTLPLHIPEPLLLVTQYADQALNEQWMIARAAKPGAIAYETPETAPTRGAFTKMFVQALRQYRIDGELTLSELQGFVRYGVKGLVAPKTQVPTFAVKDDENEFVIVAGPPIGQLPDMTIDFPPEIDGEVVVFDRTETPVTPKLPIVNQQIVVRLPPGQYTIEHEASGRDKSIFHLGPEETRVQF